MQLLVTFSLLQTFFFNKEVSLAEIPLIYKLHMKNMKQVKF